ncbi:MAG: MerR family transcriptional regulator [Clostridia bacterium]|nr:MerR family transcriptional regulator [Clostridia bacterium]
MPSYTTGEVAKMLSVTVRTVQYYDQRSLVSPSSLTEGGRRMYSEDDIRRLKAVCYLREVGLPIVSIHKLVTEEHPEDVIALMIDEQKKELSDEIADKQRQFGRLEALKREMRSADNFSLSFIHDIAYRMDNKRMLRKLYTKLIVFALLLEALEWAFGLMGFIKGVWLPIILYFPVFLLGCALISYYYAKSVDYICPACHEIFTPGKREMLFARHTLRTRNLTCTHCGHKGFAIEVYKKKNTEGQ